jgi:hypothetical protein
MAPPRSAAAQKLKKQQDDADLLPSDEEDSDFRLSDGEGDDGGSGSDSDSDDEGAKRGRKRAKQEQEQPEQKEPACVSFSSPRCDILRGGSRADRSDLRCAGSTKSP